MISAYPFSFLFLNFHFLLKTLFLLAKWIFHSILEKKFRINSKSDQVVPSCIDSYLAYWNNIARVIETWTYDLFKIENPQNYNVINRKYQILQNKKKSWSMNLQKFLNCWTSSDKQRQKFWLYHQSLLDRLLQLTKQNFIHQEIA